MTVIKDFDVGFYHIRTAFVENYDKTKNIEIGNLISHIEIKESIMTTSLVAKIVIVDSMGFIESFPLMGEEILTLEYEDFYQTVLELKFHIESVDQMEPDDNGNYVTYILTCYSPEFIRSESLDVKRSFRDTVSGMANTIYREYLNSTKPFDIEETTSQQLFVIPSLTPFEAITFLARKAYTNENPSSDFYFFENRQGFHFKTSEQMIRRYDRDNNFSANNVYFYDPALNLNIDEKEKSMNNVWNITIPKRFDTIWKMRSGSMINEYIQLDILNQNATYNIFKYNDNFDAFTHMDTFSRKPHTESFINDHYLENNVRRHILSVTDDGKPEQNYEKIVGPRLAYRNFLNQITVTLNMYGRNDLFPGDLIKLEIPEFETLTQNREPHRTLSGFYMIKSMRHVFHEKMFMSEVTLIKDSLKGELA